MTPAPLPAELREAAPGIARRLAGILTLLATTIARVFLRDPRRAPLILPLWKRLTRNARRFDRIMARLAAGTPPRPSRKGSGKPGPRPVPLPGNRGWIIAALRHEGVVCALRLEALLAEPETAAILAQSPQAVRILRPLCHMLGVKSAALPPRPSARRKPAGRKSEAPSTTTRENETHPPQAGGAPRTLHPILTGETRPSGHTYLTAASFAWEPPSPTPRRGLTPAPCPRLANRWPFGPMRTEEPA